MTSGNPHAPIAKLRQVVSQQGGAALTDAQLLDAFVTHNDTDAFEHLVWRHGPMVIGDAP